MYMWSSTKTWSRSTDEAIEVVRPLLVRDGRDRRLQPGDVRLERDRHLVAEAALHARADRAQEPGRRRRHAERRSPRRAARGAVAASTPSPSSLSHSASSASGSAASSASDERRQHQPRLVPVAELAQPPHRRQRRRQVDRAAAHASGEDVIGRSLLVLGALKRCACRSNIVR